MNKTDNQTIKSSGLPSSSIDLFDGAVKETQSAKCEFCGRKITPHDFIGTYPDLCFKCADDFAQAMNDLRPD